jgi:hypothetical protein
MTVTEPVRSAHTSPHESPRRGRCPTTRSSSSATARSREKSDDFPRRRLFRVDAAAPAYPHRPSRFKTGSSASSALEHEPQRLTAVFARWSRCANTSGGRWDEPRSISNFPVNTFWPGAPRCENVCTGAWMRRRRRMSASARATVRRCARLSLHGARLVVVPAAAVAAGRPPLLPQPDATSASTATVSARADCDTAAELSGGLPLARGE